MRRRLNMIPFGVTIPEDERDLHFGDKKERLRVRDHAIDIALQVLK
jgi:hypothetical protein